MGTDPVIELGDRVTHGRTLVVVAHNACPPDDEPLHRATSPTLSQRPRIASDDPTPRQERLPGRKVPASPTTNSSLTLKASQRPYSRCCPATCCSPNAASRLQPRGYPGLGHGV